MVFVFFMVWHTVGERERERERASFPTCSSGALTHTRPLIESTPMFLDPTRNAVDIGVVVP